jgi:dTDP-4-amino-4,6-dideoxygalactose transaminase
VRRRLALLGGTSSAGDCRVAIRHLLRGGLVDGPALGRYEREFASAIGSRHGIAFATGRVGLYGILRALGVGPGDEVILQAPTHIVVANAIRYTGARPVYADCVPGNWNIDLEDAARRVTPATKVLLVQHTFGIPADMDAVMAFVAGHELLLLEDCVHALGATWRGRPVGTFGRAAFFSTEETKVISTTMGGMVVTDDDGLAARVRDFQRSCKRPPASLTARYLLKLLAYHVLTQPHVHRFARAAYDRLDRRQPLPTPTERSELEGGPRRDYEQRLGNAQAAIGLRQLRRLSRNIGHRRAIAATYAATLGARGYAAPTLPEGAEPAWVRYPVHVVDRDAAVRAVAPHAVAGTWFSSVLEEAASPAYGGYTEGSCPAAEDAARHLLNLPTHERVRPQDAAAVATALPLMASSDFPRTSVSVAPGAG